MLSLVTGALALTVGPMMSSSTPARGQPVSMAMETSFVYGTPTPASKGLPGFSSPTSFSGVIVPTGMGEAAAPAGKAAKPLFEKWLKDSGAKGPLSCNFAANMGDSAQINGSFKRNLNPAEPRGSMFNEFVYSN